MRAELALAASAALWCGPAAAPVVPPLAAAFRIPLRLPHAGGVAITFDDGPHPHGTPAVLEALREAGVRATFFLVGEQVERAPSLAREIAEAGHEIALHGYVHTLLLRRTAHGLREDFARAEHVIADASGAAPTLYRPPYGVFSAPALVIVRRLGWRPLLWSRWGRDWERRATARSIAARASTGIAAGDVILLHDSDSYSSAGSWRRTAAALPFVFDTAAAAGVSFQTVSQSR